MLIRAGMVLVALGLVGCGGGGGDDFGQTQLETLDTPCMGVAGLTGSAVLARKADMLQGTLSYITANAMRVNPTALTVTLTWPAAPVAVCYPPFMDKGALVAQARVAVEGLTLTFKTADGKFDESLSAKAWLMQTGTAVNPIPAVVAVTSQGSLRGSWEPFPDYTPAAGSTMPFVLTLVSTTTASGNVGMGSEDSGELGAGIFRSRFAMATF